MNKKILLIIAGVLAGLAAAAVVFYCYAFTTLKQRAENYGGIKGFRLFADGIVIDHLEINPAIKLTQVYLHGMPWELLRDKPEYVSISKADIDADKLLSAAVKWPFATQSVDIPEIKIHKKIMNTTLNFTGFAKQTAETPLLLDFNSDDEKQALSGKAEIRIENNQVQMIDINFDQADIDFPLFGTKRSSGWLSFSYEDNWQVVGEMDAGITLIGPYQFFDANLKLTGAVTQPEMTFSGQMDQQPIVIDERENAYFLRQGEKTLPVTVNDNPLQEIILTLDKVKQYQIAEAEAVKQAEAERIAAEEKQASKKKKADAKKAEKKQELPPPVAFKIEPVTLPETNFTVITSGTSLSGFLYKQPLVQVIQPCPPNVTGQCWTAHGQGGQFSYNPDILPAYFLQLKDYEQLKQLRTALLDFNVQTITIQGKDKTAQKVLLKGTTSQNQPAEIQLAVLGLE